MKTFTIDLYDYYKIKKPEHGRAFLHGYILDLSSEVDVNRKNPSMLVLPGGGYSFTSFREGEPVCIKYLSYGFNSFYLEYSVAPVKYPYQLLEAIMAMNYIKEHDEEFHINKDMVAAIGFSAGGHLCGMLGSYNNNQEILEIFTPTEDVKPKGVILSYPVVTATKKTHGDSFKNLIGDMFDHHKLSIENLVGPHSSPAFIWSTYCDDIVPIRNSLIAAMAYEEAKVPFAIHIFGKGPHGLSLANDTVYTNRWWESVAEKDIDVWFKMSINWLSDIGVKVK